MRRSVPRRLVVVVAVVVLVLATVPGAVGARTTVGATVTVPAGETLDEDLTAAAARVVVRGTVDGDVTALAGNVVVTGTVTGDVTAFAGRTDVSGQVGGRVTALSVATDVGGTVGGDLNTIGGTLSVQGRVRGDVDAISALVTVEESGVVRGTFRTTALRTQVDGTIRGGAGPSSGGNRTAPPDGASGSGDASAPDDAPASDGASGTGDPSRSPNGAIRAVDEASPFVALPNPATVAQAQLRGPLRNRFGFSILDSYRFLANVLLGAVLVGLFPNTSRRIAATVYSGPVRTGGAGLLVVVLVPVVLLLFGLSLFGLPLALAGGALFLVLSWVGAVYGRFAVGVWLLAAIPRALSYVDVEYPPVENRWACLLVGATVVGLLHAVPYVGEFVDGIVLVLGLGGVARLSYQAYRRTEGPLRSEPASEAGEDEA